jgi:NADH-quinone oxidoreductase subunit M
MILLPLWWQPWRCACACPVRERTCRRAGSALATTLVDLRSRHLLWTKFDQTTGPSSSPKTCRCSRRSSWSLGIDGIALMLIMLSVFLMPLCILASWDA